MEENLLSPYELATLAELLDQVTELPVNSSPFVLSDGEREQLAIIQRKLSVFLQGTPTPPKQRQKRRKDPLERYEVDSVILFTRQDGQYRDARGNVITSEMLAQYSHDIDGDEGMLWLT